MAKLSRMNGAIVQPLACWITKNSQIPGEKWSNFLLNFFYTEPNRVTGRDTRILLLPLHQLTNTWMSSDIRHMIKFASNIWIDIDWLLTRSLDRGAEHRGHRGAPRPGRNVGAWYRGDSRVCELALDASIASRVAMPACCYNIERKGENRKNRAQMIEFRASILQTTTTTTTKLRWVLEMCEWISSSTQSSHGSHSCERNSKSTGAPKVSFLPVIAHQPWSGESARAPKGPPGISALVTWLDDVEGAWRKGRPSDLFHIS